MNSPANPLQLSWVRYQARCCRNGSCSHSEAGERQIYSFGGGWRLIEALVVALGMRVLQHSSNHCIASYVEMPLYYSALSVYQSCMHVQASKLLSYVGLGNAG